MSSNLTITAVFYLIVMFRCGPCQRIAPVFQQLATKYIKAVFLKVDVDKCQETAAAQGVSAMPTFIFYRNKVELCFASLMKESQLYISHQLKDL